MQKRLLVICSLSALFLTGLVLSCSSRLSNVAPASREGRAQLRPPPPPRPAAKPARQQAPATPAPSTSEAIAPAKGKLESFKLAAGAEDDVDGIVVAPEPEAEPADPTFSGRADARINRMTQTRVDALSTFAIDVDTAAYSIARRSLTSERLPTPSLVRVEEFVNFFEYGYEPPTGRDQLFSIEATGARSPVDREKHMVRIGVQARQIDERDRKPVNLVFLVDTSGSMSSRDKLELAQRALSRAVERLDERDQVAITTYAGSVSLVLAPTSGSEKSEIRRALQSLRSSGGTAMNDGMKLAYEQARAMMSDGEVTRVIVCSDGDANIGPASPQAILDAVGGYVEEGIRLTTIGFGTGNYQDYMMEQLANRGNGNYFYIDSMRQADRVFGRDLFKMLEDVAQDVKIQVAFDPEQVSAYRLVGYENRDVADEDFRNDAVDAGEIGAGHQVTALYEVMLTGRGDGPIAEVRVRAKRPLGTVAKETSFALHRQHVDRPFAAADADFQFAVAAMAGAELLRRSPYASGWTYNRVVEIARRADGRRDPDRSEFIALMQTASNLTASARR